MAQGTEKGLTPGLLVTQEAEAEAQLGFGARASKATRGNLDGEQLTIAKISRGVRAVSYTVLLI